MDTLSSFMTNLDQKIEEMFKDFVGSEEEEESQTSETPLSNSEKISRMAKFLDVCDQCFSGNPIFSIENYENAEWKRSCSNKNCVVNRNQVD